MNTITTSPKPAVSESGLLHQSVDLRDTGLFPTFLIDYLDKNSSLAEFYSVFPTLENAKSAMDARSSFDKGNRAVLVAALNKQYANEREKPDFSTLLSEKTYTVTTGHQLNIFTGPLYVIYKIVSTINLARSLKAQYPDCEFVPVYWMATEDHDFEEIASFHLFGKTYQWQQDGKGAVGRLNPQGLETVLAELPERIPLFDKAYLQHDTLAEAVRSYMNELFGKDGLVCLNPDDPDLKRLFLPVVKSELLDRSSGALVSATTTKLNALGYQGPVHPRELNLFYLVPGIRERIVWDDDQYHVLNTTIRFTVPQILEEVERYPERFSPNVVLRPLYEEVILPNLAYIGGPSEIPYWMQLKGVFDHHKTPFPMLIPRNFVMYVNAGTRKRFEKLGLAFSDIFMNEAALRKHFVEGISENKLDLISEKSSLEVIFDAILDKAMIIDKSLESVVKGEKAKLINGLDHLEKRIKKAEERNHETQVNQLLALKEKLFPAGSSQERYDNFLNFYLNDSLFIKKLFATLNPLDFRFNLLIED